MPGAEDDAERPDKVAFEARYAARRMRELVESGTMLTSPGDSRPLGYGDIAVLLRSANVSGSVWRRELAAAGVPVEAGQTQGFFESGEIEVTLSLLSLIDNPRQDVQLVSVAALCPLRLHARRAHGHTPGRQGRRALGRAAHPGAG